MRSSAMPLRFGELASAKASGMDELAFLSFYERTARPLRTYLLSTLNNRSLSDDILQESYLRLLQAKLPLDMEENHRKNYLFRIATNLMRAEARFSESVPLEDLASTEVLEAEITRREDLRQVLDRLKPRQRELLWLAYVERLSHNEIASIVGAKSQSIRPMLARARENLAARLRLTKFSGSSIMGGRQ